MGYVLNLQGRAAGGDGAEPASTVFSSVSATFVCAASALSYSACATLSTISAAVCM
ncbi:hypothetical protein AB0K12_26680 [Nonomuraea sp. NPDC049419]|uniref:hypothetical protein n=1 Tax=Nonomuraea sp. NPDC049419 TaxID=3155772 RepID=UPI00343DB017